MQISKILVVLCVVAFGTTHSKNALSKPELMKIDLSLSEAEFNEVYKHEIKSCRKDPYLFSEKAKKKNIMVNNCFYKIKDYDSVSFYNGRIIDLVKEVSNEDLLMSDLKVSLENKTQKQIELKFEANFLGGGGHCVLTSSFYKGEIIIKSVITEDKEKCTPDNLNFIALTIRYVDKSAKNHLKSLLEK